MKKYFNIIFTFALLGPNLIKAQSNSIANAGLNRLYYGNQDGELTVEQLNYFGQYETSEQSLSKYLIIPKKVNKSKTLTAYLEAAAIGTSNNTVPFWMRTNKFGSIPEQGLSFSMIGNVVKSYDTTRRNKLFDWGFGVEGRLNAGKNTNGEIIEAYVKGRLSVIELKVGRSKDIMGIVDPQLSTGAFAISGNTLGVPKVQLGIPEYWNFPFTKGVLAFKGGIAFGTFGQTPIHYFKTRSKSVESFYHQKSLYGRIGKESWKVRFYGGLNHQAMWGNEKKIYGPKFQLSSTETLKYIIIGKAFGSRNVESSKIGNHIGTLDQGVEIRLKNFDLTGYHQFFYDVGALYYLANIKDGIWGLSIKNKQPSENKIWDKILLEFVYSKSQAGEFDAKKTPSGDEDYYNNYIYKQGWSYEGENLGNALFTSRKYARTDLPNRVKESTINNRLVAYHAAVMGNIADTWAYNFKLTYSRNSGTYGTSPMGNTTGRYRKIYPPPYFSTVGQFSGYIEVEKSILNGYKLGAVFALDNGGMIYNSVGGMIRLTKSW